MNLLGATAVACSILAFALTSHRLRLRSLKIRLAFLFGFALLATPSVLFAVYYLHVLPERAWFYTLRSWSGTEFLVVFLGCAAAAAASLLPRLLLVVPLFALVALGVVPYLKPLIAPIPESVFHELWRGGVCLQSTPSTCGPASVATILRRFGARTSEQETARASFSSAGGTEAWYLARYVRSEGLVPRFDFRPTFSPSAGLPAVVGVRLGGAGHFIAVLEISDGQVAFADPLSGEKHMPLSKFQDHYQFTGFHMVITKGQLVMRSGHAIARNDNHALPRRRAVAAIRS